MEDCRDYLRRSIEPLLEGLVRQVVASDQTLIAEMGVFSTEAFLLRGYAGLRNSRDGEEIAITVDAKSISGAIKLTYDVCLEGGEVLSPGAEATLSLSSLLSEESAEFSRWLLEFRDYLEAVSGQLGQWIQRLR